MFPMKGFDYLNGAKFLLIFPCRNRFSSSSPSSSFSSSTSHPQPSFRPVDYPSPMLPATPSLQQTSFNFPTPPPSDSSSPSSGTFHTVPGMVSPHTPAAFGATSNTCPSDLQDQTSPHSQGQQGEPDTDGSTGPMVQTSGAFTYPNVLPMNTDSEYKPLAASLPCSLPSNGAGTSLSAWKENNCLTLWILVINIQHFNVYLHTPKTLNISINWVKSLGELLRALGVFQLCSFPLLVNNCGKVGLKFRMHTLKLARSSIFDVFLCIDSAPLLLITSLTRFFLSTSADDRNTHPSGEKGVLFAAAAHRVRPVCGWRKREGDLPVYGEDELTGTEAHVGGSH
ncbi:hypothetical protein XENOCAPTIV_028363 [Xenoophorus captivus]|uniref:Uncharacterized protein n=1 Tax=Xenoophorus captivus TaxID=1517983 RepID=A0ABV0R6H6_9TELE